MIENNAFHNLLINVITLFDRVFGPICLEPPYKFIFPSYIYAVVVNACCDWYEFVTLWLIATITLSRILEFFFFTLSRAISTCLLIHLCCQSTLLKVTTKNKMTRHMCTFDPMGIDDVMWQPSTEKKIKRVFMDKLGI